MRLTEKVRRWFKGLTMIYPASSAWSLINLGRTRYDYASQVGEGRGNSAMEAVVRWIGRTFPEAPPQVLQMAADGTEAPVVGHPMLDLLSTPNKFYSGELLWRAMLADWASGGNGYWLKRRNGVRGVAELWWAPAWTMAPAWPNDDPTVFISHYDYTVNGVTQAIPVEDVVHFRDGMDPSNTRKGLSVIGALAREIFTDDEAANMTASLVKNMGVPGVIISPEGDDVELSKTDGDAIKADFKQRFGGDNRGEPMVMPARTKVTTLSWSPEQMNMRELRRVPEERVCAMLGVPAIVVGLGAGLDRATYANMAEAREAAYESFIIPNQRLFGADLKTQLLSDYGSTRGLRVGFDTRAVRVLQEDENKRWARTTVGLQAGLITRGRGKELLGEKPEPGDNVYYVPSSAVLMGPDAPEVPAAVPPPPPPPVISDDNSILAAEAEDGKALAMAEFKGRGTSAQKRLFAALERDRVKLTAQMAAELDAAFVELGNALEITVDGKAVKGASPVGRITTEGGKVVAVTMPEGIREIFRKIYEALFRVIVRTTGKTIATIIDLPVGVNLDDPVTQGIIAQWATRKGLADIDAQTRAAIMQALEDGRKAGDGVGALTERIKGMVEGRAMYPGVYQDAYDKAIKRGWSPEAASRAGDNAARSYRAETIARTETKTAQNKSAIMHYRENPMVKGIEVFDGDDCGWGSHDDADKADGKIVTFDEAEANPLAHPRCVRSFGPHIVEE